MNCRQHETKEPMNPAPILRQSRTYVGRDSLFGNNTLITVLITLQSLRMLTIYRPTVR